MVFEMLNRHNQPSRSCGKDARIWRMLKKIAYRTNGKFNKEGLKNA